MCSLEFALLRLPYVLMLVTGSLVTVSIHADNHEPEVKIDQILRELTPGKGLLLGEARVEGNFNAVARSFALDRTGPLGRDYSVKMVWSPDRGTAWFLGANHGKPHRLNDVWEFDLASMRWRMAYAPDNSRSYLGMGDDPTDVVYKNGILQTIRGGPAVIGHTWWGITYDPEAREIVFMNTWVTNQDKIIQEMGGNLEERIRSAPLWTFSHLSSSWAMLRTKPPYPKTPFGGLLEYIPELGGVVWHSNNWQMRATWLYSRETREWRKLTEHGTAIDYVKDLPAREQVGYYDPGRRILVVMRGGRVAHFDVARKKWTTVLDLPESGEEKPDAHDARTPIYYDPVSGHGVLCDFGESAIWTYNPDTARWRRQFVSGDPMPVGKKRLAYLDPQHNVLVVIDGVRVWVYRYHENRGSVLN